MLDILLTWDRTLFLVINSELAQPWLDVFFITITNGRFWIVPGALAVLALFAKNDVERAATVVVLAAISVALTDSLATFAIKPLVHRLRPCNPQVLIAGGHFLLGHKSSLSFPSNHAINVFGLATLFALLYPRFTAGFALFAGLIGFSRIYVGVHYPLDVWAGALLGATIGVVVYSAHPKIETVVARFLPARARSSRDTRSA